MNEDSEDEMLKGLDANNYKGIYVHDPEAETHYIDPYTGAHFEFHAMIKELLKVKLARNQEARTSGHRKGKKVENTSFVGAPEGGDSSETTETRSKSMDRVAQPLKRRPVVAANRKETKPDLSNCYSNELQDGDSKLPNIRHSQMESGMGLNTSQVNRLNYKRRKKDLNYDVQNEEGRFEPEKFSSNKYSKEPQGREESKAHHKYISFSKDLRKNRQLSNNLLPQESLLQVPKSGNRLAKGSELTKLLEIKHSTRNKKLVPSGSYINSYLKNGDDSFKRERSSIVKQLLKDHTKTRNIDNFRSNTGISEVRFEEPSSSLYKSIQPQLAANRTLKKRVVIGGYAKRVNQK